MDRLLLGLAAAPPAERTLLLSKVCVPASCYPEPPWQQLTTPPPNCTSGCTAVPACCTLHLTCRPMLGPATARSCWTCCSSAVLRDWCCWAVAARWISCAWREQHRGSGNKALRGHHSKKPGCCAACHARLELAPSVCDSSASKDLGADCDQQRNPVAGWGAQLDCQQVCW